MLMSPGRRPPARTDPSRDKENIMSTSFFEAVKARRSVYALGKQSPVSNQRIEEIVSEAVKHAPSAFNSQSARAVILFGRGHDELWDHTLEVLRGLVKDPDALKQTEGRIAAFRGAYGTVLYFEDQAVIAGLQENFALYKDNFPVWSHHSAGMLQFVVWAAFAAEGLGANLQHYSPLIDAWVARKTGVPASWKLVAQMPFGTPLAAPAEKAYSPVDQRVIVLN
jgi:predicted oxidoreductase (fatty acid repression mutant protein)